MTNRVTSGCDRRYNSLANPNVNQAVSSARTPNIKLFLLTMPEVTSIPKPIPNQGSVSYSSSRIRPNSGPHRTKTGKKLEPKTRKSRTSSNQAVPARTKRYQAVHGTLFIMTINNLQRLTSFNIFFSKLF